VRLECTADHSTAVILRLRKTWVGLFYAADNNTTYRRSGALDRVRALTIVWLLSMHFACPVSVIAKTGARETAQIFHGEGSTIE
jgi:hypothetical protein